MNTGSSLRHPLIALLGLALAAAGPLRAADPEPAPEAASAPLFNVQQQDQLMAPIALYPDALVALILPAATNPTEIVLAARYLEAKGDPTKVDDQPWADSVKALARYPDIVKWMDENLQWTKQVGEAFLAQPSDLMNAVQRLRARARATGALVDTPQQAVVVTGGIVEIVPVQPDVIYVPRYDPEVVYVMQPPGYVYPYGPYVTFGIGFPIGYWLIYDFDWNRRTIWVGDRHHDWREHREWRRQHPSNQPNYPSNPNWRPWRPPANHPPLPPRNTYRTRPEIERPRPFPGTPISPRPPRHDDDRRPSQPNPGTPRPPRGDSPGPRPPHPEGAPRPEHRGPPPGNVVVPRPPMDHRPPSGNTAPQQVTPQSYQQRVPSPGTPSVNPVSSAGRAPTMAAPPPMARTISPPAPPPPPPPPPAPRNRDQDLKEKQN